MEDGQDDVDAEEEEQAREGRILHFLLVCSVDGKDGNCVAAVDRSEAERVEMDAWEKFQAVGGMDGAVLRTTESMG